MVTYAPVVEIIVSGVTQLVPWAVVCVVMIEPVIVVSVVVVPVSGAPSVPPCRPVTPVP